MPIWWICTPLERRKLEMDPELADATARLAALDQSDCSRCIARQGPTLCLLVTLTCLAASFTYQLAADTARATVLSVTLDRDVEPGHGDSDDNGDGALAVVYRLDVVYEYVDEPAAVRRQLHEAYIYPAHGQLSVWRLYRVLLRCQHAVPTAPGGACAALRVSYSARQPWIASARRTVYTPAFVYSLAATALGVLFICSMIFYPV